MKSAKTVLLLVGLIILTSLFLSRSSCHKFPSRQERRVLLLCFEDFNSLVGGNDRVGASQRKHLFEKYRGRYVRWSGEVEEIIKEISGDYTLRVRHGQAATSLEVSVRFDASIAGKLLSLKRGDAVNYMGKLVDFDPESGYYLEDGEIE